MWKIFTLGCHGSFPALCYHNRYFRAHFSIGYHTWDLAGNRFISTLFELINLTWECSRCHTQIKQQRCMNTNTCSDLKNYVQPRNKILQFSPTTCQFSYPVLLPTVKTVFHISRHTYIFSCPQHLSCSSLSVTTSWAQTNTNFILFLQGKSVPLQAQGAQRVPGCEGSQIMW